MSARLVTGFPRNVVALTAACSVCSLPARFQPSRWAPLPRKPKAKTAKPSGKVYTNDSLKSDPRDVSTPAATPAPATPSQPDVNADDKAKQGESGKQVKDEAYWRDRIKAERDALARAETFAAALQSQINGLYAEFTACQAPPQQ